MRMELFPRKWCLALRNESWFGQLAERTDEASLCPPGIGSPLHAGFFLRSIRSVSLYNEQAQIPGSNSQAGLVKDQRKINTGQITKSVKAIKSLPVNRDPLIKNIINLIFTQEACLNFCKGRAFIFSVQLGSKGSSAVQTS